MRAILCLGRRSAHEPEIRFVHQRRALQSVARALCPQKVMRKAMKFVIDQRN
jgi:hypothetical protein